MIRSPRSGAGTLQWRLEEASQMSEHHVDTGEVYELEEVWYSH